MHVCVIGGSGFLGSHVCDKLSQDGYKVRIFDRVPSPWIRSGQTMIEGDVLDEELLQKSIYGCTEVYNFAGVADLDEASSKPLETVKLNVLGNVNVLEACLKSDVKRYIYASTIYVYSREGSFYRCSKQSAEHYIEEYQRSFGLDYTILRFGSLYGPRSNLNNGLHNIVKRALETGIVSYVGSKDALREYIHIEDAASASVSVLRKDFINKHVVITGLEPMRVYDMLEMLAEILGMPNSVKFNESEQKAGHYVRTPYAYHPKMGLKFVPSLHVDLGQGLLQLIEEIQKTELNK